MTDLKQQHSFWLADWRVKPSLSEIERQGSVISLEPKVMAVLVTLASKPGEVFSRQELEDEVWQGTVVGYDALAKAINKLREALGDDKKNPNYIQTISKKGYRLVAEVNLAATRQKTQNADSITTPKIFPLRKKAFGTTMAIVIIGFAIFLIDSTEQTVQKANIDTKPTVVVLPFRNISPSDKDDYLADGITSDLTTNLSKLSSIWVTSSNASLAYKNTDISPDYIKQSLKARYVIGGEVNKIGQTIRINVHLTDLDKGTILWAERYDRQFIDLFAIQDEVTQKIIDSLSLTLTIEEKHRIAKRYTNNMEAYDIFLRAQILLNTRTAEDNIRSRELFIKAIELDPDFARAYASISYSYSVGYLRQWPADTDHPLQKALQLANQALEIDKDLPEAYWAAAFVYFYQANLDEGTKLLNQALKLNPNFADAYALLASNSISQGKPKRALDHMANAYRLNPTGGYLYDMQMGRVYYFTNNYELALQYLTSALDRNPTFIDLQMYMAAVYIQLGKYDEAGWMIIEAKQSNPEFDPRAWVMVYPFLDNLGYRNKLLEDIALAETYEKGKPSIITEH